MRLPPGLLARLLTGAVLFAVLGWFRGEVLTGACTGLMFGSLWFLDDRKAAKYRRSFNPADRTLTRPPPTPAIAPITRRYGLNPFALTILLALTGGTFAMAALIPQQTDTPTGIAWFLWAVALLPAALLTWQALRLTTISPYGIAVHSNLKTQTVTWAELAEVRWHRTEWADTLLLRTRDSREIKTVGAEVHYTGMGRRRMERMLADIERAWAVYAADV